MKVIEIKPTGENWKFHFFELVVRFGLFFYTYKKVKVALSKYGGFNHMEGFENYSFFKRLRYEGEVGDYCRNFIKQNKV